MLKFSVMNDSATVDDWWHWWQRYQGQKWFETHDNSWHDRGPTTIYDEDHPIEYGTWCSVCGWFHFDGTVCHMNVPVNP